MVVTNLAPRLTIVLVHIFRVRVLAVPEMVPLGGRHCDFDVFVFLVDVTISVLLARLN